MKFFSELSQNLIKAFKRFPLAVLWAIAGSFYCIAIRTDLLFEGGRNVVLTFVLGISWLLAVRFLVESFKNPKKYFWLDGLMLGLLVVYFISLPTYSNKGQATLYIRWALLLLAGHVFLFFAPFLKNGSHSAYWNYLRHIIIAIGRSILFSSILYLGLVLAFVAIQTLLKVDIDSETYVRLFIFCLGIVKHLHVYRRFPHQDSRRHNDSLYEGIRSLSSIYLSAALTAVFSHFVCLRIQNFNTVGVAAGMGFLPDNDTGNRRLYCADYC